jgi:hypothetical protein
LPGNLPKEVVIEDKTTAEQIQLIQQLEEEDKKQSLIKMLLRYKTKSQPNGWDFLLYYL